jgi:Protein of unknown function (DUF664)
LETELVALRDALNGMRAGVLKKLAGLSEVDARRSTVPSGTNVEGLIQHLTFVESHWFEEIVAGRAASRRRRSMTVDPEVTLSTLRAEYRAACETSEAIAVSVGDPDAPVTHKGKTRDLRWVLVSLPLETARHAGHADISREQIDGRTGL